MPYTGVQFAAARQQVALRLADPTQKFWTDAEMKYYLWEALQVFASLSGYWKDTGLLNTTAGSPFFNLSGLLNGAGVNPLNLSTDALSLLAQLQYALLEPVSTAPIWPGTEMFSYAQIQAAIQRRADQFLIDTGANLLRTILAVPAPPIYRYPLTGLAGLLELRRVAWKDTTTGHFTPMLPGDEFEWNAFSVGWQQKPGVPGAYSVADVPVLTATVNPPPLANGALDVVYTATSQFAALPTDSTVPILADYAWAVKYGALADLLNQESEAKDAARAAYCEQRYQQGVELCQMAATVIQGYYLGVQLPLTTLEEFDRWSANWQNTTPASPLQLGAAGLNLFAVNPTPNAVYQLQLDVVASAVLPVLDADYIQLGPEALEAIYGYAQHAASFKMGGEEFTATLPLFQNLLRVAALYNARLTATSSYAEFLADRELRTQAVRPRISGIEVEAKQ